MNPWTSFYDRNRVAVDSARSVPWAYRSESERTLCAFANAEDCARIAEIRRRFYRGEPWGELSRAPQKGT